MASYIASQRVSTVCFKLIISSPSTSCNVCNFSDLNDTWKKRKQGVNVVFNNCQILVVYMAFRQERFSLCAMQCMCTRLGQLCSSRLPTPGLWPVITEAPSLPNPTSSRNSIPLFCSTFLIAETRVFALLCHQAREYSPPNLFGHHHDKHSAYT